MGWSEDKVDELVLPVMQRIAEYGQGAPDQRVQSSIGDFFPAQRVSPKIKR